MRRLIAVLVALSLGVVGDGAAEADDAVDPDVPVTAFCAAKGPRVENCAGRLGEVRAAIKRSDPIAALQELDDLNRSSGNLSLISRSYSGGCEGTGRGGLCTDAEWQQRRFAALVEPDRITEAAQPLRGLIAEVATLRAGAILDHLTKARGFLKAGDWDGAAFEWDIVQRLGGGAPDVTTAFRAHAVETFQRDLRNKWSAAGPTFHDETRKWFAAPVLRAFTEAVPNECVRRFGEGTSTDVSRERGSDFVCSRVTRRPLSEMEVASALRAVVANTTLPPSKQRPLTAVIQDAATAGDGPACPPAMSRRQSVDVGRTLRFCLDVPSLDEARWSECLKKSDLILASTCFANLTIDEYCPGPDGHVSYGGRERPCSRAVCAPGLTSLSSITSGNVEGCFVCPDGEIDVAETLRWKQLDARLQFAFRGRVALEEVLCRVGPPLDPPPREVRRANSRASARRK